MRRREKFVISSLALSTLLVGIQYTPLEWRLLTILGLGLITYLVSSWALSDDLSRHERLTIVPFPALFAMAIAWFYFLLPSAILTRLLMGLMYGFGMYGLLLTSNIFSVAKGRSIQLLYAAHAVSLFFTLLTSVLFADTIFSQNLPIYFLAPLIGLTHLPLALMSLWSVKLSDFIEKDIMLLAGLLSLLLTELAIALSFFPLSAWNSALFVMSFLYISLGVIQSVIKERLFTQTLREYLAAAVLVVGVFVWFFPGK